MYYEYLYIANISMIYYREGPFPNYLPSGILKFGNGNFSGIRYSRIFRIQEFREFGIPVRDYQIFSIPVYLKNLKKIQTFIYLSFFSYNFLATPMHFQDSCAFSVFPCTFGITVHFVLFCHLFISPSLFGIIQFVFLVYQ